MTLEEWREHFNWTQQELADRAHVAMQTVSRIERGLPTNRTTLARIADALDCETSDITGVKLNIKKKKARRG